MVRELIMLLTQHQPDLWLLKKSLAWGTCRHMSLPSRACSNKQNCSRSIPIMNSFNSDLITDGTIYLASRSRDKAARTPHQDEFTSSSWNALSTSEREQTHMSICVTLVSASVINAKISEYLILCSPLLYDFQLTCTTENKLTTAWINS